MESKQEELQTEEGNLLAAIYNLKQEGKITLEQHKEIK